MKIKILIIAIIVLVGLGGGLFLFYKYLNLPSGQETPAPQVQKLTGQWVCGSAHNHILVSEFKEIEERVKPLIETVAASRELGFGFVVLSEKGETYDLGTQGEAWQTMLRECQKATTTDFICLPGQEITTPPEAKEPLGHFVTIDNKEYIPLGSVPEIFAAARRQNAVVIIAHPFYKKEISPLYYYDRWDILDWDGVEVINGVVDETANQKALQRLYEFWSQGLKKSAVAGADLKTMRGEDKAPEILMREEIRERLKRGYTCLYVDKLDAENIKKAIKEGKGYVSSGPEIKKFTINGSIMGEELTMQANEPLNIEIDLKADSKIKVVKVNENSTPIKEFQPLNPEFNASFSLPAQNPVWYNLEVYSEDGQAFSNAIWIKRT